EGDNFSDLNKKAQKLAKQLQESSHSDACPIIEDTEKIERVWDLRKAGLGLLMGLGSDGRTPTFGEDTSVRVADLPEYIDDFQDNLNKTNSDRIFNAQASVDEMPLHLVINHKKREEIEKMKYIAAEIADLVRNYTGSLSWEHGVGRTRAPYIEKVLCS